MPRRHRMKNCRGHTFRRKTNDSTSSSIHHPQVHNSNLLFSGSHSDTLSSLFHFLRVREFSHKVWLWGNLRQNSDAEEQQKGTVEGRAELPLASYNLFVIIFRMENVLQFHSVPFIRTTIQFSSFLCHRCNSIIITTIQPTAHPPTSHTTQHNTNESLGDKRPPKAVLNLRS